MTWADTYALRLIPFEVSKTASTYGGAGDYGEGTYGQEASDPLTNVNFVLAPSGSQYPSEYGWQFHVGDAGPTFSAVLLGLNGVEPLAAFDRAALIVERVSHGNRVIDAFEMEIDTDTNILSKTWGAGQLALLGAGVYRVLVQLVSGSGRALTVSPTDAAAMIVKGHA